MFSLIFSSIDLNINEKNKFEAIYYKYKGMLFYTALNIVKNDNDAEDILQEAFIKTAKNIKLINDIESRETASFLIVITKNTAYDHIRKTTKITELPLSENEIGINEDRLNHLVCDTEYKELISVITSIPSPYNEVLYLHYAKDYSIKKTAKLLDRKESTVKMQLVRGKKILAEKLSEVLYG